MSVELILGILGTTTGIAALIIQAMSFRAYVPRLKFKEVSRNSFAFDPNDLSIEGYKTDKSCVITFEIRNISAMPTTIDAVYISARKKRKYPHDPGFRVTAPRIPLDDGRYTEISIPKNIVLPLRIDAYDSVNGSFRFPFMPDQLSFIVCAETPLKTYSRKVKLEEFQAIRDRVQSQYRVKP